MCIYKGDKDHYGALYWIVEIFQKYSVLKILDGALKSGDIINSDRFKSIKLLKGKIKACETSQFQRKCVLYKSITLFNTCITLQSCHDVCLVTNILSSCTISAFYIN